MARLTNAKIDLNQLLAGFYDAALDDALWAPAIDHLAELVGAHQSALFNPLLPTATEAGRLLFTNHIADEIFPLYYQHYWQFDAWALAGIERGMIYSSAVNRGENFVDRRLLRRGEFFDFLQMHGSDVILSGIVQDHTRPQSGPPVYLSLYRPLGAESFHRNDEKLLSHALPHIQRAMRLRWQLAQEKEARALREHALDRMDRALALLDETGRLLFANRKAEALFHEGHGPTAVQRRLTVADDPHGASHIKQALLQAALGIGSSVKLENPSQQKHWIVTFSPLRVSTQAPSECARILALIAEPDQAPAAALPQFAKLYRLTQAETKVMDQLLLQTSTQEIADALQISIKTLRNHLASLYAKTATSGQRELVRFFLSHPAMAKERENA